MKVFQIIAIFLVVIVNSCVRDYSTLTEFSIENNSGQNIEIRVSNFETEFFTSVDTVFNLGIQSQVKCSYELDGEDAIYKFPFGVYADSAMIIFNDTVSVLYTKDSPSPGNLLNLDNYSGGKVKDGLYSYVYEVSEQDYLDASGK